MGWAAPAVIACLALLLLYRGYAGDDTFIHLQYARNLAMGEGFSFNPGEPSYGSTAPLWTILIAGVGRLLGSDFYLAAKLMSVTFTCVAVLMFFILARRTLITRFAVVAATLAFAVDPWILKWGGSGMETSLAIAIALAAMLLHLNRRDQGGLPASAFLLGLGTLVRPELVGLFLISMFDRLAFARRPLSEVGFAVVLYLVPILPWLLYAYGAFGDVVPATVHAKAGHMERAEVLTRIVKIVGVTYWPLLLAVASAGVYALRSRGNVGDAGKWLAHRTILWGWLIGLPAAYLITRSYVASRYLLIATPVLILLGFAALKFDFPHRVPRRRAFVAALVLFALTSAVLQTSIIYPRTRFSQGVGAGSSIPPVSRPVRRCRTSCRAEWSI
jgi:hypothetical protein